MKQILCSLTILLEIRILSIQCDLNTDLGPTKNSPSLPYLMPFSYFQFHAWINADFLPKKRPAKIHTQVLNIIEQLMNWNPPGYSAKAAFFTIAWLRFMTIIWAVERRQKGSKMEGFSSSNRNTRHAYGIFSSSNLLSSTKIISTVLIVLPGSNKRWNSFD